MFNGVFQLCILYLPDAFKRYLKLSSETQIPIHKVKRFAKIKGILKLYLTNLIKVNIDIDFDIDPYQFTTRVCIDICIYLFIHRFYIM